MKVRLLRDVAHIQTGPFGSQLHKKDYVVGGIPIVTVEHLGSRRFTLQNLPSVNEADSERLSRYRMKAGDIIFSRVGSVDRCSLASAENDGWLYSGRCLRVRTKSDWSSDFLYYYLSSARMKKMIRSIAVGATMPSINTSLLGEVLIPQMPLKKQVAIASVLSAFDERIELNSRLNGYLAALGEAIATRHSNEADGTLDDICNQSKEAVSFDSAQLETYVSTENLLPNKAGLQLSAGLPTSGKVTRYRKGDTLIANIRPYFKKIWYATDEGTCSGDVIVFRANDVRYAPYVFFSLFCDEFFKYVMLGAKGTKMPRGDKKQMMTFPICTNCNSTDLQLLHELASMIGTNHAESRQLARLRDVLLPELMSGEIDVSKVDLTQLNSHLADC